jgi:high-affinity nickel-transport protein
MTTGVLLGLMSTLLFGLRHGIDYDHIAAITDITSTEREAKRGMRLGMLYAFGHGAVVLSLGCAAVLFGKLLPHSVDTWMERVVGLTLILLGLYVFWTLMFVPKERFAITSRFELLSRLFRRRNESAASSHKPYDGRGAFLLGVVHGVGAETPTQLGLFLFAAGVGGRVLGLVGVLLFVAGVLLTNSVMCAVAVRSFRIHDRTGVLYRGLAGFTAAYSLVVGFLFLFQESSLLPAF